MHQHAVMTMAWRRLKGDSEAERILRLVVDEGLILSASGTLNPAMISVEARPCEGGFAVSGRRRLCSGSPGADVLVTAARLVIPSGARVITVLAPLRTDGVEIVDDWHAMGMRGSGSNSVQFDNAFVPEEYALYVDRPAPFLQTGARRSGTADGVGAPPAGTPGVAESRDQGPPGIRMPGLHISLPIIAATYLGAATGVRDRALATVARTPRAQNPATRHLAGLLTHEIRMGWWALLGMTTQTTDDSLGARTQMVTTMLGKRQVVLSSIAAAELATEMLGSQAYMIDAPFERVLRDVRAGLTHPLPPQNTLMEVGRVALAQAAEDEPTHE
jgi:acyl-CoA dehydrogenase